MNFPTIGTKSSRPWKKARDPPSHQAPCALPNNALNEFNDLNAFNDKEQNE
jgi:hypothetical protein